MCGYGGWGGEGRVLCGQGPGLGESPACRSRQKAPCLKLLPPLIYDKTPCRAPTCRLRLVPCGLLGWNRDSAAVAKSPGILATSLPLARLYQWMQEVGDHTNGKTCDAFVQPSRVTPLSTDHTEPPPGHLGWHNTSCTISQPGPPSRTTRVSISQQLVPGFGSHPRAQTNWWPVDLDSNLSSAPTGCA